MASSLDRNNFLRAVPRPFGLANWVTLVRAIFATGLMAIAISALGFGTAIGAALRWWLVAGALLALALDGLDGTLARRLGQAGAFGARFDLETDALTMLALGLLVWEVNQAGAWVLLSGLMRYIFVIGGRLWPVLAMPLPPSKRRQSFCVVQLVALIIAVAPPVTPFWGGVVCLIGLGFLAYSFGVDMIWLAGRAGAEGKAAW